MSALHTSPKFTGFFRRLVEEKHVSAATMQTALDAAKRAKQDTVAYLIEEVHLSLRYWLKQFLLSLLNHISIWMFMTPLRFLKIWSIRN